MECAVVVVCEAGADVNIKDKDGHSVLLLAASKGHKEIAEMVIKAGADVNIKDKDGHSLLFLAASP